MRNRLAIHAMATRSATTTIVLSSAAFVEEDVSKMREINH